MIAGTLELQMSANLARLSADMNQAKSVVGGAMKDIGSMVERAKGVMASLGVGIGIAAFAAQIKSVTAMRAALDDLSDTTGDNITMLDGLRRQGIVSGVALDQMGGALTKLARNMNNADDDGQAAAQALKAIGLNVDNLRTLKPAEAMLEIAKSLDKFSDGAGKVAVATALMGKEGAKMLPFLKDLVNDGDAAGRVTAEQAAEAERLEKALRRLQLAYSDTKDELATGLIPKMARWVEENREAIKIAGSASEAARLFVFNLDAMTSERPREEIERLTASLKRFQEAGAVGKFMQSPTGAMFGGRESDLQKQIEFLKYLERSQALDGRTGPQFLDARDLKAVQKPILDPGKLGGKAKEITDEDAAYRGLLKSLKEKLLTDRELTEVNKLNLAIEALSPKQLATITDARRQELKALAEEVDLKKRLKEQMENEGKNFEAMEKIRAEGAEVEADATRKRIEAYDANQKAIEQIEFETSLLGQSNDVREIAIALRALELSGIKKSDDAYENETKRLREALTARNAMQAALEAQAEFLRKSAEDFHNFWSMIESTGKSVFVHVFSEGRTAFEGIGKAIKASVIDLLYQMTARKWIIEVGASVSGSFAAGTANAGGSMMGGIGNVASSLGSKLFDSGTMLSGAGAGTALAEEAAALGIAQVSGGLTAGLASIGPVGWAAIAAGALLGGSALFGGKGAPKASELSLVRNATGDYGVGNNNIMGGPDYGALKAMEARLNSGEFDFAKLDAMAGQTFGTGSPADTAALLQQMTQALGPAAESARNLAKAAEELAAAEKRAAEEAAAAQRQIEQERIAAIQDAVGVLRQAYQREAGELEAMASKWHAAAEGLRAYGASLIGVGTGGVSYAAAARAFASTARQAQLGDLGAVGSLQGVSEAFRTASLSHAGSALDYARDVGRIRAVVGQTADLADRQENVALEQRDLLKSQVSQLIDINDSMVTVAEAIRILNEQSAALNKVTKDAADDARTTRETIEGIANGQYTLQVAA